MDTVPFINTKNNHNISVLTNAMGLKRLEEAILGINQGRALQLVTLLLWESELLPIRMKKVV
jgi:hypothetical protein